MIRRKLSPITLHRSCFKNKKKTIFAKPSSCSIKEITKGSFDAAVQKCSASIAHHGGGGGGSNPSSWVKTRLLGRGSYGSVYLATRKNDKDKREMAIKTADLSKASSLIDEGKILTGLNSPFIVRCYGDEIAREEETDHQLVGDSMQYNLILEYCSGQTIADVIEDNHGGLSEFDVKFFVKDVLSGLNHIHDSNIIHCDIKPENLFLSPTDLRFRPNGYLTKLGDFGLAMEKGSVEYGDGSGHRRGTTRYMAPELISYGIVDYGVDTWALGCTVLEMLTGEVVWGEHRALGFDDWVNLIGYSDLIPWIPDWLSQEAKDFLSKCLKRDTFQRWSSYSLTNHPFVIL